MSTPVTAVTLESALEAGSDLPNETGLPKQDYLGGLVSRSLARQSLKETANLQKHRTDHDNEVHEKVHLSNLFTFLQIWSRFLMFLGAWISIIGIILVLIVVSKEQEEGHSLWWAMKQYGSISAIVHDYKTIEGKIFYASMQTGYLMIMFSFFSFFVLPGWAKGAGTSWWGHLSSWCIGRFVCCWMARIPKAVRQRSWVLQNEGLYKITWNIIAPLGIILVANVPAYRDDTSSDPTRAANAKGIQGTIHSQSAQVSFILAISFELYQLLVGERLFGKGHRGAKFLCCKVEALGMIRFILIVFAAIGVLLYVVGSAVGKSGSTWNGIAVVGEAFGGVCLALDFVAITFAPMNASQVALVYSAAPPGVEKDVIVLADAS